MCASSLHRSPANGSRWRWLGVPAALVAASLVAGCGHPPPPKTNKAIEVVVTKPISDYVLDYQDFTGRVDAFRTVDVRARVTGYVDDATFKEGDTVKKGQVLFQIDARSYKADLAQAEATLKQALADRELQELNSGRARRLVGTRAMGKEEYDHILGNREKAEATVGAMQAARDRAALYVDYTKVIAPLSGRISRRNVDPGNLVKADDTLLTTIVADDPVYVYFDVDERTYLDLVGEKSSAKPSARVAQIKLPVMMRLANEKDFTHSGHVDFVDNRLNGNTGTIRMRGVFPNPDGTLKSGLFARIRLPIGSPYKPLLIPDEALQSDQGRKYVYVVDEDNKVEYRLVTLGQALPGLRGQEEGAKGKPEEIMLRVIKDGLKEGERVIISGQQRVRPTAEVHAQEQKRPKSVDDSPVKNLLNLIHAQESDKETR